MAKELQELQFPQTTLEEKQYTKVKLQLTRTSSRFIGALCTVCAALLIVIIVLIIAFRYSGEKSHDQSLKNQIQDLSDIVKSKFSQLTQDGDQMVRKLQELDEKLEALWGDQDKKSLDEALNYQIRNLSDSVKHTFSQILFHESIMEFMLRELQRNMKPLQDGNIENLQGSNRILNTLRRLSYRVNWLKSSGKVPCLPGWRSFGSSCYFYSPIKMSWNESSNFCEEEMSHLVVINTEEEQKFAADLVNRTFIWIGLTDVSGDWRWVDGTDYQSTTKAWSPGQPDNHSYGPQGVEDCVHLHSNGRWNDDLCIRKYQFLCEMDM